LIAPTAWISWTSPQSGERRRAAPRSSISGGLAHDTAGSPEQIMAVNVLGTWHVLLAAEAAGATRVIHFSSAQALGIAEGERLPDYFPVDDAHPRRAIRAYGLSKCLAEDLCAGFTARTGTERVAAPDGRLGPGPVSADRGAAAG
jgi:dTDP-4-dehydrorhamnose reductase